MASPTVDDPEYTLEAAIAQCDREHADEVAKLDGQRPVIRAFLCDMVERHLASTRDIKKAHACELAALRCLGMAPEMLRQARAAHARELQDRHRQFTERLHQARAGVAVEEED